MIPNSPSAEAYEGVTVSSLGFFNKVKRLRLFEPSVGILGLTVCAIVCFFVLDYRSVRKGVKFPFLNQRLLWVKNYGDVGEESRVKIDFLSDVNGGCDLFDGDWVWDENYPLYKSKECGFLDEGFRCTENGRPDSFYTQWRWQPKHCNLPRFDAKALLEKLRNKRIVFAGDSIGRNQWESLLCMLSSAVSNQDAIYEVNGSPITKHKGFLVFKFSEYNTTVEYYRSPFLVLQSRPPARVSPGIKTTLKLDRMDWMSSKWLSADVLVLNTGHWWNYEKTLRGGCYFQEGRDMKMNMEIDDAYRKALETIFNWVRSKVDARKTQVVFRTYAPVHFRGGDWRSGGTCHLLTLPDLTSTRSQKWPPYSIFAQAIAASYPNMSRTIEILNITHMTSRRKDGHSSLYYKSPPVSLHRQDCSHWCLPGVPDAWNELLYAMILKREANILSNSTSFHAQV